MKTFLKQMKKAIDNGNSIHITTAARVVGKDPERAVDLIKENVLRFAA